MFLMFFKCLVLFVAIVNILALTPISAKNELISSIIDIETIFDSLQGWVKNAGGRVDDRLSLVSETPWATCRGIITKKKINPVSVWPLVIVPESLEINGRRARASLEEKLPRRARSLDGLDSAALIVLWLAAECATGKQFDSSPWKPYLQSLPSEPPCGWYIASSEDALCNALFKQQVFDENHSIFRQETERAQQYVQLVSQGLFNDYAHFFSIQSPDLIAWALGIVSSRSMGGDANSARLVPLLDLINHNVSSRPFTSFDAAGVNAIERFDSTNTNAIQQAALSLDGDDWALYPPPFHLAPGDEITANYLHDSDYTILDWWIQTGFCPNEFLSSPRSSAS